MMNKFRKLASVLLIGAFAVSLTACGTKDTSTDETSSSGLTHYTTCSVLSDEANNKYSVLSVEVTDDEYYVGQNGDGFVYVCDDEGNVLGALLLGDEKYFTNYQNSIEEEFEVEDENDKLSDVNKTDDEISWTYYDSSEDENQYNMVYIKENLTVRLVSSDEKMIDTMKGMIEFKNKTDNLDYSDIYSDEETSETDESSVSEEEDTATTGETAEEND